MEEDEKRVSFEELKQLKYAVGVAVEKAIPTVHSNELGKDVDYVVVRMKVF